MSHETFDTCPSCDYPCASHVAHTNGKSPPEIYCSNCGFEHVASIGNVSPDGDAEEHRLNRQALEEEATAHQGLREEAVAYRGEDWWRDEDKHTAATDAAYDENQVREIEAETAQGGRNGLANN